MSETLYMRISTQTQSVHREREKEKKKKRKKKKKKKKNQTKQMFTRVKTCGCAPLARWIVCF